MTIDHDILQPVHLMVQSQAAAAGRTAATDFLSSPSVDQADLRSRLYVRDPDVEDSLPYCDTNAINISDVAAQALESQDLALDEMDEKDRADLLADLSDGYCTAFNEAMFGQVREDLGLIYS